ncbi:MAG: adenylate/guanylate cyclase domain-containing protein [Planctomycetota bacterium]
MPDLIAQGNTDGHRWRRSLPEMGHHSDVVLGRGGGTLETLLPRGQIATRWAVGWDPLVSRVHAKLTQLSGDRLEVQRVESARNPVYYRGRPRDRFVIVPGEHFVIGSTTFTLVRRPGVISEPDAIADSGRDVLGARGAVRRGNKEADGFESELPGLTEMSFEPTHLRKRHFRDSAARIDLLTRLPDLVSGSVDEDELLVRVTDTLLRATPMASMVAIVCLDTAGEASASAAPSGSTDDPEQAGPTPEQPIRVLHCDGRSIAKSNDSAGAEREENKGSTNAPSSAPVSGRLVHRALKRRETVLHAWHSSEIAGEFTMLDTVDWAFCVPLAGEACRGWGIYVAGRRPDDGPAGPYMVASESDTSRQRTMWEESLGDDIKFAEMVASMVAGVRQTARLQQRQAAMRRFFAPVVLDALSTHEAENYLKPRQCELAVMFCDLRGFSRTSEEQADRLLILLEQVSAALGVMTKHILNTGGVIGDFHGDAAMGFWGWPIPLAEGNDALPAGIGAAVEAASAIRRDYAFGETEFRCGIGIASGSAVAGRIGTVDQVKVTAFGPVVNLASRMEGLTKIFGVEVLIDDHSAISLVNATNEKERPPLRQLGRVRVAGMATPVRVHQCVVPVDGQPQLTQEHIAIYDEGWRAFSEGDWDTAYARLHELPVWDRPKDVLMRLILQHHRTPPSGWDGVLDLPKS